MQFAANSSAAADLLDREGSWSGRNDLLVRPRLLDLLRQGLSQPLTILSAPAGFGKTVAMRQFVDVSGLRIRPRRRPTRPLAPRTPPARRVLWAELPDAAVLLDGPAGDTALILDCSEVPPGAITGGELEVLLAQAPL